MPQGGWLTSLREQAGAEIPAGLRLIAGAASGAALSLSYTGQYRSVYSWVCVGILLFSLLAPGLAWLSGADFFTGFFSF